MKKAIFISIDLTIEFQLAIALNAIKRFLHPVYEFAQSILS